MATPLACSGLDATSGGIGIADAIAMSDSSAEVRADCEPLALASTRAVVWTVSGVGVNDEVDRKLEKPDEARAGTLDGAFAGTLAIDSTSELRTFDSGEFVDSGETGETVELATGSLEAVFDAGVGAVDEADIELGGLQTTVVVTRVQPLEYGSAFIADL